MQFDLLGWPAEGPTLSLDHRTFSYAGKFVMSNTGKAVARVPSVDRDDGIVAAVAFNADRTDPETCWLRYVTVHEDYRGEGIGPRLVAFVTERITDEGFERVNIAVNNPYAFQALSRAGFGYTGEQTGVAELVMAWPAERDRESYQAGLDVFRDRDLTEDETALLDAKAGRDPPDVIDAADSLGERDGAGRPGDSNRSGS